MRIILASGSPRRKELLETLISDFEIIPSSFDEDSIKNIEKSPSKLVEILSLAKARDIFEVEQKNDEDLLVIGGDTIVYFDGEIIGKPKNEEDAFKTLERLQSKSNEVYTGTAIIIKQNGKIVDEVLSNKTLVNMKKMSKEDIEEYISSNEPLDKAGSYAVQGTGEKYIESIDGDYYIAVDMDINNIKKILAKYCNSQFKKEYII